MKTSFSFLFVFMFLLGFGQSKKKDKLSENERVCANGYQAYKNLEREFDNTNFSKLYLKIISDIDFSKIKKENLVFYFRNLDNERRGSVFEDEIICNYNGVNAFYNQTDFWKIKTIKYIQKKYHKNLIPYLQRIDSFIFEDNEEDVTLDERINGYYFRESKMLIEKTKNQAKGLFIKDIERYKANNIEEKIIFEKRDIFYYFPYKKHNLILKNKKGTNENYSTLFLEFANRNNKVVVVKFQYNLDEPVSKEEDTYYKTYQYQNKNWVEIPTKKEHEF